MNSNYKLYILGCRGTHPVFGRKYEEFGGQTSCYILKCLNHAIIIDCGTGLYDAKELLEDCSVIDIVLTHVHYDHILGFLNSNIFNLSAKVTIYGTLSKWFKSSDIKEFLIPPFWPVCTFKYKTVDIKNDGSSIKMNNEVTLKAYPSNHPDNSSIMCLFINEKKVSIISDFEYNGSKDIEFIRDSDVFLFDGMYDLDDYKNHIGWGHSSWSDAVIIAKKYNCKQLYITHHNPDYDDNKLLQMEKECKKEFNNSRFARVNDIYNI